METAFEAELNAGIPGIYVVDKLGEEYDWIPETTVPFTKQDQTTQVRFFLEMVDSTRKPNGRIWKNGIELRIEDDDWDNEMFFTFEAWQRGDTALYSAANPGGLGKIITIEPANGSYYSLLIPIDAAQAQAEVTKILGR